MKKKGMRLAVLGAVVLLLAAVLIVLQKRGGKEEDPEKEDGEFQEEDGTLLYSFDYEDMKQIAFSYMGQSYSFTKTDGIWTYDEDKNFPVHQVYMEAKAATLAEIYVDREIEASDSNLADYGLEEPQLTVQLTLEDGEVYKFRVGNRNETAAAYYMYDEKTKKCYIRDGRWNVAFGEGNTGEGFQLYDIVELEAMPVINTSEITHIYFNGEEILDMNMLGNVAALGYAKGVNYAADDETMASYGLAQPGATLKVVYNKTLNQLTSEQSYTLLIGNKTEKDEVYVCMEGSREVHTIEADKLSFLLENGN